MKGLINLDGRFYKKCKVVMLPTEKAVENCLIKERLTGKLNIASRSVYDNKIFNKGINHFKRKKNFSEEYPLIPQHLYILSDEEIKEDDWKFNTEFRLIWQHENKDDEIKEKIKTNNTNTTYKIIASTDPKLTNINIGLLFTTKQILKIPSEFVEEFCKVQGIWEVLVEPKIFKQGLMTFTRGYKVKNDELVIRFDIPNVEEVTITVSLIENILRYCEDKKICDKLGDYGDFYNQLKMMINKEYEF